MYLYFYNVSVYIFINLGIYWSPPLIIYLAFFFYGKNVFQAMNEYAKGRKHAQVKVKILRAYILWHLQDTSHKFCYITSKNDLPRLTFP